MTLPAIYCRVSSQEQADAGHSLAMQDRQLRAYCVARDWGEPVAYVDAGVSAFNDDPAKRPAFARLLADCDAGLVDTVVVTAMNRWARSTIVTVQTLKRFEARGVRLISLGETVDWSSAIGRLVLTVLASLAEYESADKSIHATRTHAYLKSEGKWDGGKPPFGARLDAEGRIEVDPDKAAVLTRLLTLAATTPPASIAKTLAEEGIPPPGTGYRWVGERPAWWPQAVRRIVAGAGWLRGQGEPWVSLVEAAQRRPVSPRLAPDKPIRMLTGLMRCQSGGAVSYGGAGKWNRGGQTVRCRSFGERPGGAHCPLGHTYVAVYERAVCGAVATLAGKLAALDPQEEVRAGPQQEAWAALDGDRERVRHMYRVGALSPERFEQEWAALDAQAGQLARQSAGPVGLLLPVLPALLKFPDLDPPDQNALLRRFALRVVVWERSALVEWRPGIAEIMA